MINNIDSIDRNKAFFNEYLDELVNKYKIDERFDGAFLYPIGDNDYKLFITYNRVDLEILKYIPDGIMHKDCFNICGTKLHTVFYALDEECLLYSGVIYNSKILFDNTGKLHKLKSKSIKKREKFEKVKEKSKRLEERINK